MRRFCRMLLIAALTLLLPALASADTRALLVACTDFVTQPNLGNTASGNLQMIGSALLGVQPRLAGLSVEDGTIGTEEALGAAIANAFGGATERDLSILYLCTHGVLSSADDGQVYLLLGDGATETPLSAERLYELIRNIQGEKLVILDACYSGALLGRGRKPADRLPGVRGGDRASTSPFLTDPSVHVLTSADSREAGWYYDSDQLATGAVSYFASALSTGLGLYGTAEADQNGDGALTLRELHEYLRDAVPSSTSQLLSCCADTLALPVAQGEMLSRPLTGFSYGGALLSAGDPTLDFSFTVSQAAAVQYRLIEYGERGWDWAGARSFLDAAEGDAPLAPGRRQRSLTLPGVAEGDSGYLMLQVFAVSGEEVILCSERLIAVQGGEADGALSLSCPETMPHPGASELPVTVALPVPAELTVSVYDASGALVRRLAQSQMTRPSKDGVTRLYWDGRNARGEMLESGDYVIAAETSVGGARMKATSDVRIGE